MAPQLNKERCQRCGKGEIVTDTESGEIFCSMCGYVMTERMENSGPEWRSFSDDSTNRGRTGDKISLSRHDMGLATQIDPVNKDATGKGLSAPMKMTISRLRIWDSRSQSKPIDRNVKIAFSELHKIKDKPILLSSIFLTAIFDNPSIAICALPSSATESSPYSIKTRL